MSSRAFALTRSAVPKLSLNRLIGESLRPQNARVEAMDHDSLIPLIADDVQPASGGEVRIQQRPKVLPRAALISQNMQNCANESPTDEDISRVARLGGGGAHLLGECQRAPMIARGEAIDVQKIRQAGRPRDGRVIVADVARELVSATGHGSDEIAIAAEQLAQRGDLGLEIVVLDDAIRPHAPHQLVLVHDGAVRVDQRDQGVEGSPAELDGAAVDEQLAPMTQDLEATELWRERTRRIHGQRLYLDCQDFSQRQSEPAPCSVRSAPAFRRGSGLALAC